MAAADIDERVLSGLRAQLESRRRVLEGGGRSVGWKIGLNVPAVQERLGITHSVIGFLTDAAVLEPGVPHSLQGTTRPAAEAEIAIELRRDVEGGSEVAAALAAIDSLAPALEIVDFNRPVDDVEEILAGNVFHRAVVLGTRRQDVALSGVEAAVTIDGEERERAPADVDLADTIRLVADLLDASGERLLAGDVIIAGSLTTSLPLEPGNALTADFGPLGAIEMAFT